MSEFNDSLYGSPWNWKCHLHTHKACQPRGGSTVINTENAIFIFGGVNRDQEHFSDLLICRKQPITQETEKNGASSSLIWEACVSTGDIPTARSGHAVCSIGKFMFLSAGIDFTEEVVYNDLYVLNIETLVWKYVGEKGEEITGRNSHSLHIVTVPTSTYPSSSSSAFVTPDESNGKNIVSDINVLVMYGGASPEHGPSNEVFYAVLPSNIDDIDQLEFYIEWIKMKSFPPSTMPTTSTSASVTQPCAREMHSSCAFNNCILICGGRDENGILSDTWLLEAFTVTVKTSDTAMSTIAQTSETSSSNQRESVTSNSVSNVNFTWYRMSHIDLPIGRCSHAMTVIPQCHSIASSENNTLLPTTSYTNNQYLTGNIYIFGGFTANASISNELIQYHYNFLSPISTLPSSTSDTTSVSHTSTVTTPFKENWQNITFSTRIQERFGTCMCNAPTWYIHNFSKSTRNNNVTKNNDDASNRSDHKTNQGLIIFGGVNANNDLADVWLIENSST